MDSCQSCGSVLIFVGRLADAFSKQNDNLVCALVSRWYRKGPRTPKRGIITVEPQFRNPYDQPYNPKRALSFRVICDYLFRLILHSTLDTIFGAEALRVSFGLRVCGLRRLVSRSP